MRKPSMNFVFEECNQRSQASYQLKYMSSLNISRNPLQVEKPLKQHSCYFFFNQIQIQIQLQYLKRVFVTSLLFELKTACFSVNQEINLLQKIILGHQLTTMKKHTNKSDYLKVRQKIEELCCIEAHHLKKVKQNIYG